MSELKRDLGVFSCSMLVAGNMIGIGIFVTAGRIYQTLPNPKLIIAAWLFGGFLSVAGALTYAELGTRFPRAGGGYIYLREAFGPFWGFLSGFSASLVTLPGAAAFLAIGFTRYAGIVDPGIAKSVAILLIVLMSLVNYWGVKRGAELQNGFMIIKLLLIAVLVIAGFLSGNGDWLHFSQSQELSQPLWIAFPLAMVPVMYTYSGWDATAYISGEIKDPNRTIPVALFSGAFMVMFVYIALACLYLYAIPVVSELDQSRIVTAASSQLFGPVIGRIVGCMVAVSILGCLSATILTGPRIHYAMAKDKLFPSLAGDVHPLFSTPGKAIWIQAVWSSVLVLTGTFNQLLDYVTVPSVFFASVAAVGLFFVRHRDQKDEQAIVYRTLGYPVVPLLFILGMGWIVVNTAIKYPKDSLWGLFIVGLGVPIYFIWNAWARYESTSAKISKK